MFSKWSSDLLRQRWGAVKRFQCQILRMFSTSNEAAISLLKKFVGAVLSTTRDENDFKRTVILSWTRNQSYLADVQPFPQIPLRFMLSLSIFKAGNLAALFCKVLGFRCLWLDQLQYWLSDRYKVNQHHMFDNLFLAAKRNTHLGDVSPKTIFPEFPRLISSLNTLACET